MWARREKLQVENESAGSGYQGQELHWVRAWYQLLDVCNIKESIIKYILAT